MLAALDRVSNRNGIPANALHHRLRPAIKRLRSLPPVAWIAAALVVAIGFGLATRGDREHAFFRAQTDAGGQSIPAQTSAGGGESDVGNPDDAMLRAAPESTAELLVVQGEEQLRAGKLMAPEGDNAGDSLLAAWQTDPSHLRLAVALDKVILAAGSEAARRLGDGEDTPARDLMGRTTRLAEQTERAEGEAMRGARDAILRAFNQRVDRAAAASDRPAALRGIDSLDKFGLGRQHVAALTARAKEIPTPGDSVADPSGDMRLMRTGGDLVAASTRPVSRADYAAFAGATGREESLCRERASLLRIVARRSWKTPGFPQSTSDPVVCVSWQDANAYANWLSRRNGERYRLPSATESRQLPASGGPRAVAEWSRDCSGGCDNRLASGRSWRGDSGARALEAARGYDDVGFRLVREP